GSGGRSRRGYRSHAAVSCVTRLRAQGALLPRGVVAGQGPGHVFPDQRVVAVRARAEGGQDRGRGGGVAQGDGDVAQPAAVAAAADRRAFGTAQELVLLPGEQVRQAGGVQVVAGAEVRFVGAAGELVPGAYQLAVVAAEDAVADRRAQLFGDCALVLD